MFRKSKGEALIEKRQFIIREYFETLEFQKHVANCDECLANFRKIYTHFIDRYGEPKA